MSKRGWIIIYFGFGGSVLGGLFLNCSGNSFSSGSLSSQQTFSKTCYPGPGATGSPKTIEEVVTLINSLPKPVTVDCVLQSLDRPLDIYGTSSSASAQPSSGPADPRIFIFKNNLAISVVTNGAAKEKMEFGLVVASNTSQKGELTFPVQNPLAATAAFDEIRSGGGTDCAFCHRNERPGGSTNSFISDVVRPNSFSRVTLDAMIAQANLCNSASGVTTYRCGIFKGIFNYGPVRNKEFP